MSTPIPSIPTTTGEFQAHFGGPPNGNDVSADCKKWEQLCGELLCEREKLRAELRETSRQLEACAQTLFRMQCKDYKPTFTKADVDAAFAKINEKPSVQDIVTELATAQGR